MSTSLSTSLHQIAQANLTQKIVNLSGEVFPQVMGQTSFSLMTVAFALTIGHVNGLIDRVDDFSDKDLLAAPGQSIAAAGATRAGDKLLPPQFSEQLLQIDREISCLPDMSVNETGLLPPLIAKSSMAVTA